MKILFLSHYSFLYGSNKSLTSLINYYSQKGEQVEVMLPSKGEFYKYLLSQNVQVHNFMFLYEILYYKLNKKYLSLPLLWIYDLIVFPFLCLKIFTINPDIIYSNSSADLFSVWVAKILHKKHVIHVREFMEEDFGGKCVFGRRYKRNTILRSDAIICVSEAIAKTVVGDLPPKAKVIYNGLPSVQKDYNYPDLKQQLRIGVVGNIDVSKQQDLAIGYMPKILERFPYAELHIIGDKECPYKKKILSQVAELQLEDKVIFDGFIKEVEQIYSKFDVLLMCSRCEAFGRVTIEAMLRKKPVIGYNAGGTVELIEQGVTGFKFENVDDVIWALEELVVDNDKLKCIIDNALKSANTLYTESNYVSNNYQFVKSLL